jgi:3-deoxy-manno-octulosonate cytidylyltransferase (CMP-KDO synthetase)
MGVLSRVYEIRLQKHISQKYLLYDKSMETIVVIPARFSSSRFPGKPLAKVAGKSLISRVWHLARAIPGVSAVYVATDSEEIAAHVAAFGGDAVMTSPACRNGSERVWEAVQSLTDSPSVVVNLQGDAVLMPQWVIEALVKEMRDDPQVQIATPVTRLSKAQYDSMVAMKSQGIVSGTTVTFSQSRDALYFSKGIIPFVREWPASGHSPIFQHIGVYAYRREALGRYVALPLGELEAVEQLEQLRALEYGIPIRVVDVPLRGRTIWSIDNPQDVERVEQIIRTEGELL